MRVDAQRPIRPLAVVTLALALGWARASAQSIRGRVVDESTDSLVSQAGVFLMDTDRNVVSSALGDDSGLYDLPVPAAGEYYLHVQRLGYFETESPLVEVRATRDYVVDFSLRPEPIRLDGIQVEVPQGRQNRWASERLRTMQFLEWKPVYASPAALFGFRLITGMQLAEAKFKSDDTIDLLRWLYVPVYNTGDGLCANLQPPRARRRGWRTSTSDDVADRPSGVWGCAHVYVDGRPFPAEHLATLAPGVVHAVMVLGGELHIITVGFEAKFLAGRD